MWWRAYLLITKVQMDIRVYLVSSWLTVSIKKLSYTCAIACNSRDVALKVSCIEIYRRIHSLPTYLNIIYLKPQLLRPRHQLVTT